jgi:uncharacterized protein YbjT (DUF2867 family)
MSRYILTGTSGNLGSRVLQQILQKNLISPSDLIVSTSDPNQVSPLLSQYGIEQRYGDFTQRTTLQEAFTGADVLLLISHPSAGAERIDHHTNAIEAAREAGVKTIVYTSMMFGGETGLNSVVGVQQGHVHTMKYLAQSGMDHIILREGIYAQFWEYFVGIPSGIAFDMFAGKKDPFEWVVPNDGAIALVDWSDLSEGTAMILSQYEKYVGQTLRLTGPRAEKISDIAKLVTQRTGKKVDLRIVGIDEALRYHDEYVTDPGKRRWIEEQWSLVYEGLSLGEGEVVDSTLARLLGRPVRGLEEMGDEFLSSNLTFAGATK